MLVLATDNGGEQLWTSASHVVIVTRDGRIVRTLGLPMICPGLTTRGRAAASPAAALRQPFTSTRLEDFPELGLYGVVVTCSARRRPAEDQDPGPGHRHHAGGRNLPEPASPNGPSPTIIGWIRTAAWPGARASMSIPKADRSRPKSSGRRVERPGQPREKQNRANKKGRATGSPDFFKSNVRGYGEVPVTVLVVGIGTAAAAGRARPMPRPAKTDAGDDQEGIAFHLRLLHASRLAGRESRRRKGVRDQQGGGQDGCTKSPHQILHKDSF